MNNPNKRKPFLLRIDPHLWLEIERWAREEIRSVNAQIEYLLQQALRQHRRPGGKISPLTPASTAREDQSPHPAPTNDSGTPGKN